MSNGQGFAYRLRSFDGPKTALCLALLTAIPGTCGAFDIDYEIGMAAVHSDNIALTDDSEASDTVLAPRLRFDVARQGSAVKLQARGQIEHRNYLDDTFPSEWRGEFAGQFDWSILPARVNLVLEDYLSHQPVDLGVGLSPGNLQRVNVFLGGPSFHARFNGATRAQLDLRAANSYAEVTEDFNGDRFSAAARLQRELSSTQQASLNLVATEAQFDEPGEASDYSRQDAFIGYRREQARGNLQLELGRSWLRPEAGRSTVSATLAGAAFTWAPTARSRLGTYARYQLADSTQDLIIRQGDLSEPVIRELVASTLQVNAEVYRQRRFHLDYQYSGDRLTMRLRPRYRSYRYVETTSKDNDDHSGYFELGYRVRTDLTLSVQATALNREFVATQRKDQDRVYGVEADYRWSRHLSSQIGLYRNTRTSTVAEFGYEENVASLTVVWSR